jgi:hypothetical protein
LDVAVLGLIAEASKTRTIIVGLELIASAAIDARIEARSDRRSAAIAIALRSR